MVSLITEGSSTDAKGRPYPRRRMRPWLILVVVLTLSCAALWTSALTTKDDDYTPMACNAPSPATDPKAAPQPLPGQRLSADSLADVDPAPMAETRVRVLNANGQRGQAAHVAAQLGDLGFGSVPGDPYGNDPIYANGDLECTGQIRFGESGRSVAAAVQLAVPCAELIADKRTDNSVDLVLGSVFGGDLQPNNDAEEVLRSLKNPVSGESPEIDPDMLEAARTARC
ncbi:MULTISPECIES: envelope integrity protein Cei [Nocardia]|uniref:envelope integrity protein Cei n=1 Tax=Nocardia TaxID=1817 RepID=UPI0018944149|nr:MULTISPECIES: envelope integrity protein Cei [Nocardia]MBF6348735.1 envelope integrity protein Cei [Nocardia flavorosea]